ncbi:AIPR family protein [Morganella morganii]|uniref:AIPR family protein n=1 Tax=Morganellaceae TaxID=1903414 RepID=UPI00128DFED9|nr:AIPR family protein [Morganella morganii]MQC12762.1 AIPR family protein [Morganella morganii]
MISFTIKNKILVGILSSFRENFNLINDEEEKLFEKLVSYIVCSKTDPESFNSSDILDDIDVDKSGTFGIDSIAIFVNGRLVTCKEDVNAHTVAKRLDAKLVFIQSKRSSSVDTGDLLKFITAVKAFFDGKELLLKHEEIKEKYEIYSELFTSENAKFTSSCKPKCELFFATTGNHEVPEDVEQLIKIKETELKNNISEISSVLIKSISADYIIDSYNEIENTFNVNIDFKNRISCGKISGVEQSFIGYLPFNEFIKLLKGSDGNIRKNLFYENVRDYQGAENSVNKEISRTIHDENQQDKFLILNNGVTIVSKNFINLKLDEFQISDYYIVNGCQTSNVIYSLVKSNVETEHLNIPVKIIHTLDNNIINSIIRSTNKQTPVPDEAFLSLDKFHKRLQDYYKAMISNGNEPLYYERRSKEFNNSIERVERYRIVNLHSQIKSFVSIILGEPQLAMSNNPNSILKEHKSKLFQNGHDFSSYYLSSLLLFKFHQLNIDRKINGRYIILRHWVCWIALFMETKKSSINDLNSRKNISEMESLIDKLKDYEYSRVLFNKAIKKLDDLKREFKSTSSIIYNKDLCRSRAFRDFIKKKLV